MPQLIFYIESGYPQIYNLLPRKTTIGKNDDNDIRLEDPRVSAHHAEIVRIGAGAYQLTDLNSDNGTAVNGKLVEEVALQGGDQIKLGPVNAAFVDQSESDEDKLLRQTFERDLQSKSEKLAEIEESIEARTRVLNDIPDNRSELQNLEQAIANLKQRHETERNRLESVQGEIENSRERRNEVQSELESRAIELEQLEKDRAEFQLQYRRAQVANEHSEKLKESLNEELRNLREQVDREKARLQENAQAIEEAKMVIEKAGAIQGKMEEFKLGLQNLQTSYEEYGEKMAERKTAYERLEQDIAGQNRLLEELNQALEAKQKEAANLSEVITQNNQRILSSSELLVDMDATLQKEIEGISQSQETRKVLRKESSSLSRLISGKTAVLHRLNEKFESRKNGSEETIDCPPLRVINPEMRSLVQYFQHGAGNPDQDRVNPIGYYGLAACTKGSMHRDADTIPAGEDPILVLLVGQLGQDKALLDSVTRDMPNNTLLICWREGQLDALVTEQEHEPGSLQIADLLEGVSGIISVDTHTAELIDELQLGRPHLNVMLPTPVELPEWNAPLPDSKRSRGVFISADGFDPESEIHHNRTDLLNQLVNSTGTSVTLYQPNPVPDLVEALEIPTELITEYAAPMTYGESLALMREHLFVTGFGTSQDGDYLIGDALLTRTIFAGADFNSVIDQLLFPDSCIKGDDIERALKHATKLLSDYDAYVNAVEKSQSLAVELISFETVSDRLGDFLQIISANPVSVPVPA